MCKFPRAAVTTYHRLGGLKQRNLFLQFCRPDVQNQFLWARIRVYRHRRPVAEGSGRIPSPFRLLGPPGTTGPVAARLRAAFWVHGLPLFCLSDFPLPPSYKGPFPPSRILAPFCNSSPAKRLLPLKAAFTGSRVYLGPDIFGAGCAYSAHSTQSCYEEIC